MENNTPFVIADTYQIIEKIGSGGGGVVYLAEHLRLNKKVVLKADKRTLAAKPKVLRREVDALKNLSHTYIPQVYDFIVEEGTVYTVMDYIEGESFDKPLKRGERFCQAQIIEWACQLLEALIYLHNRPPHGILHADIKPANIMLTPQKNVCLIDFNIALALGEEGAVAVGRSFGYASPEHYRIDFGENKSVFQTTGIVTERIENSISNVETVLQSKIGLNSDENTSDMKRIMLDVRSDIYSLGATLYHIITGRRPAQNATEVIPISEKECTPSVIDIIEKAMNPNPNLRFQKAEEMLSAFIHLRENDFRTKYYIRMRNSVAVVLSILFFIGGFITFVGLKQMEKLQNAYVLAEYSENALRSGNIDLAIEYALQALPEKQDIFTPPKTAQAQKALTDALNIYDLSDGYKVHKTVELPSAPLYLKLSPEGKTATAFYAYEAVIFNTDTAEMIANLPIEHSALSEVEYIEENKIIYAGEEGIQVYDIAENQILWTGKPATAIAVSANGMAASIYKEDSFAAIYNINSGELIREIYFDGKKQQVTVNDNFANPKDNIFAFNDKGTLLGVSFEDGSLWVYNLEEENSDIEIFDNTSGYVHFEGGFFEQYFAFSATNSENSVFAVIDAQKGEQTGGFQSTNPFAVETNKNGIYVKTDNILVKIHPVTGSQTALVNIPQSILSFSSNNVDTMITTKDEILFFDKNAALISRFDKENGSELIQLAKGTALIGSMDTPLIQIMRLEEHSEQEVFSYDETYNHDEARLSHDGKTVMLFSYNKFRLYDIDGEIIADIQIPDAEQVYDQQYYRDENGSRLEVIYNDGTICAYSAQDGSLLYEMTGEKPDLTLNEVFFTDLFRIEAPLHGVPSAYDKKSGKLIRELEKDSYLTYVTQVGEYIITEYITTEGERYGLLLNNKCETLARLPYLCDIVGNELIFDYPTGNLRKSRIYHMNELVELARELISNKGERT